MIHYSLMRVLKKCGEVNLSVWGYGKQNNIFIKYLKRDMSVLIRQKMQGKSWIFLENWGSRDLVFTK